MNTNPPHFFSADRPIEHLDDDRLQRRTFALSIAQAITTWHGDESLVMALYGGWGDGKSSIKGMVVDAMKKDSATCPFIVEFNPWEWAGQHQLAQVFFDEIGKQMAHQGTAEERKKAEECGRRLRKLGKYLNLTGSILTPIMQATSLAFPVAGILTPVVSKVFKKSGQLAKDAAEAVQEQKDREDVSLLKVKSELRVALTALKRNVVVMVDDVDRLAADEIKLLFQLIKANSDFPNLIFFLFFQRDIIERALGRTIRTGAGKDYLEKIVQVPLSVPHIQRPLLEGFMDSKLRELLARRGMERAFEWLRFKEMWQEGLGGYFQNVRDVVRFFGTFEFQVVAFSDPAEFDPVDLFALEVLRVFEGGVYETLAKSRHLLTPDDLDQFQHDIKNLDVTEPWKKSIKKIVDTGKATRPEAVDAVLKSLFPIESFALGLRTPEKLGRLQKQARVGHPAFFGRYFHLCVPQGDIPQTEVLKLLSATANTVEFKRLLVECDKQQLALEALTRLSAYADRFEASHAGHISAALFDEGDNLVGRYGESLWEGFSAIACYLIEAHLDNLSSGSARFAVLKSAFEATNGIYLPACLLRREGSRANEYTKKDKPRGITREEVGVLENAQIDELARICIHYFEQAAESGSLQSHAKLQDILGWWLQWSRTSDAAKVYFRKLVATDAGLLTLLEQYLGGKLSDDAHQKFVDRLFDRGLTDFEQFMPADEVKGRVEEVSKGKLSELHSRLCRVFMDVYTEHMRNRAAFPAGTPVQPDPAPEGDNPEASPEGSAPGDDKPTG